MAAPRVIIITSSLCVPQWNRYSYEDLNGLDTMIKRMLKKGSEQIVRQFEYYRVAIEQEINSRGSLRHRRPINQLQRGSDHSHFQYPMGAGQSMGGASHYTSHTMNPILQNHTHAPYSQSNSHAAVPRPRGVGAVWGGNNGCATAAASIDPQLGTSWSSSEHSNSSTRTLRAHDLEQLQDEEETFV